MTKKIEFIESSGNVFEDVGFEKQEAKKLQFKSYLMVSLIKYIKGRGLTQVEAAKRFSVTQSRMSNLMNHRIDLFSTEMLLDMMERVGFKIYEKIELDINIFLTHAWPKAKLSKKSHTKHAH
jgi:predicted XRE-type DNA-binding protein